MWKDLHGGSGAYRNEAIPSCVQLRVDEGCDLPVCCSNPVVLIECLTCLPLQWISVLVLSMFVHATHRQPVLELAMSAKHFRNKVYHIKLYWWIVYQQIAVNIVCSHCGMQQLCNHLWNM